MSRKEAFEALWNHLGSEFHCDIIKDSWLLYESSNLNIHLCRNGNYHEYQVFIGSNGSFTTVDIQVLIEDIADHGWIWHELNKIGIEKSLLGVE